MNSNSQIMLAQSRHLEQIAGLKRALVGDVSYSALALEFGESGQLSRGAESAKRASDRIAEVCGINPRGFWLPMQRDLTAGTPSAGGATAAEMLAGQFAESLKPAAAILGAGATVLTGMTGASFSIPRVTTGASVAWKGESVAADETNLAFDKLTLVPLTVSGYIDVSRRLLADSAASGGLDAAITRELLRSVMAEVDRAAVCGGGTTEPLGILEDPDIPVVSIAADGGAVAWSHLCDMEESAAGVPGALAWLTNAKVRKSLRKTARGTGLDFCMPGTDLLGHPLVTSSNVPSDLTKGSGTNLSGLIHGAFEHLLVCIWGPAALDVVVNPYQHAVGQTVRITGFIDVAVGVRYPSAFAVCKDIDA